MNDTSKLKLLINFQDLQVKYFVLNELYEVLIEVDNMARSIWRTNRNRKDG